MFKKFRQDEYTNKSRLLKKETIKSKEYKQTENNNRFINSRDVFLKLCNEWSLKFNFPFPKRDRT